MTNTSAAEHPRIVTQRVTDLVPYARNARTHSDAQVAQIAASITEFGFCNPILTQGRQVVAGHGRLLAARKLGLEQVPTIDLAHLTKTQARAYVLADNQLAMNAGWDQEMLALELVDLKAEGVDLDLLGFPDVAALVAPQAPAGLLPGTDPDAVPEAPKVAVTKVGDVITLGRHRLMCGDSTMVSDVEELMDGVKADMVFTDPPYALFGNSTGVEGVADDKMVRPFFREFLSMAKASTKPFGHIYACCDWHSAFVIESISREVKLKPKNLIVWDKGDGGIGANYQNCHEFIWFWSNSKVGTTTTRTTKAGERVVNGVPNIWRFPRVPSRDREHNAAKPVGMIEVPVVASSDEGGLVLDLFGGSGSTMIAAESTGRTAYLMELDPIYCDVIVTRWEQATGQKAVRP